ncbi:hypothetical protein [Amycolatopsis silviterrae]|uniref:Uncharacterized protein n=1 Tax=Amycolatopsis silviterrae TaxID=1656914 RepID=A0ABW5HLG5_9PSEU
MYRSFSDRCLLSRRRGTEFTGGSISDRLLDSMRGTCRGADFTDDGFGHPQAFAAFVADGVYEKMLGQAVRGAQHEFVQYAAGYGVSREAEDAALEVCQPDREAGKGFGLVVGSDAYSPGMGGFGGTVGLPLGTDGREARWSVGSRGREEIAARWWRVHGTHRLRRT